jgi:hypothetical protein
MRRLSLFAVPILILAFGCPGWAVAAQPQYKLDLAAIGSNQCTANTAATQIVDVTFTLDNYADSGYVGAWALDTVHRHLRIWRLSPGAFCAQIADGQSSFVTLAGYGPTGLSFLPAGIRGTFDGGYVIAGIAGRFSPQYKTRGNLGTFDAQCDTEFNCKGAHPSWLSYFSHVTTGGFAGWGWLYDAGAHGVWLDQANVSPPYGGDIR